MLDKPVLLLESDTVPNAAVIVTSIADSDGNSVVVALHLSRNEGFGVVTRVASLYGEKTAETFLRNKCSEGICLATAKKKPTRCFIEMGYNCLDGTQWLTSVLPI